MDFRTLFFEPKGRIGPRSFGQGYILLTGAMLVITALGVTVWPQAAVLQYALVFPYICVFGKRLHDAGQTAWLWGLFLAGYFVISLVASAALLPSLAPEAYAIQLEMQELWEEQGFDAAMQALSQRAPEVARSSATVNIISLLIASAITGFVAFRLPSDPRPNRHGPPTTGGPMP